jgi:hypothetical protein
MCLIYCELDKSRLGLVKTSRKSSAFEREYNGKSWKKVFFVSGWTKRAKNQTRN